MNRKKTGDTKGLSAYGQLNSAERQEELVQKHLKLVNIIVGRLAISLPSWIDKRDLINSGVIGLIDAAKHFDHSKGVKFDTYASTRIRGSIIDELRSLDWIPRSTRDKSKEVEKAITELVKRLGRFPNDIEIAEKLGWDMDQYHKTIDIISGTTLLSLDEMIASSHNGDEVKRIDILGGSEESVLHTMEHRELVDNVAKVLTNLAEQERLVVALYYYEELTLKEIGLVLKVTESRVSQIHTTAVIKIRAKLKILYAGT
jgi:RNA polymerase sigma factor FliA